METQPEFKELLELFNVHDVEYLLVGGYALAFHGAPRFTGDLEILVRPTAENADRILQALAAFGFSGLDLAPEDFQLPERVVQLGVPPVRIELLTSLSGLTWDEAHGGREPGEYGGVAVDFIGRKQFIANKRATGRNQDLADLDVLGEDS
ncbi:MAG: hypothetical protein P1V81_14830 [Planctomycetota bacterium]|nr:hypothetical protein [Planctomycetota bacterium]